MVIKKDEIIISGVSCRLPESENIEEFKEHLMNKEDMITEDDRRWAVGYYGLPGRSGKLKDITKFDAAFFGVSPKQAQMMDPQLRMLLEVAHEAIIDAGLNPQTMRGSRTGVFVGASSTETQDILIKDPETVQGYSLTGCQHSMLANRLSFSFDFKGPSFAVDTACSSSLLAFQLAFDSMKQGNCDSALVCTTHLTLRPTAAMQFMKLGMLSPQGKCQTFDANGDGYVRSEGVAAVFLQKESDANRIYCEVVHAKSSTDGFKEQGITYPNGDQQAVLLRTIYAEAGVDPADVLYAECHGTGTKVGDPQEGNAVTQVLCPKNRQSPLLVGSVKSNMGHAEPASGLASVCKMLIAMESGCIPPNLHFRQANPNVPALLDGRMKVVTEKTPFETGILGINSFGFGGANTHVILRARSRFDPTKSDQTRQAKKPRILTYFGRTQAAVEEAFRYFEKKNFDEYLYALMNANGVQPAGSYPYRGYMLYHRPGESAPPMKEIQKIPTTEKRPIWFVYSGMGTHYPGMGRELMKIESFEKVIRRCTEILKPHNVDPYDLIMNGGSDGKDCAICICAIQVALTETLKVMGIEPDGILGHSFGEMAAGYGDGCMTLEEAMLSAYYRTISIIEQKFEPGAMAAVGLTWEQAKARCPAGVMAACHNAKDSVTISGNKDDLLKFVDELKAEGVFAKEVNSLGIAFHSDCMKAVAKPMRDRLEKVIPSPKKRSSKWISTSVPESKWNTPLGQYCSADYHANNAVSPVLFYEALQFIPENAVLIEISPHCLLQAILRRCIPSSCSTVGLLKARHEDNFEFFLQNIGKIYCSGLNLSTQKIFPPTVRLPAPRGIAPLSPMIKWDHAQSWYVVDMEAMATTSAGSKPTSASVTVDPLGKESEEKYMMDHCIDGRSLYPFAGYVVLAWKTLCKLKNLDYQNTPICLENMSVYRATILSQQPVKLDVVFTPGHGTFEILEGDQVAASGKISIPENLKMTDDRNSSDFPIADKFSLTGSEVYKELRLRGYEYGPHFRPIQRASEDCHRTEIAWNDNFVPFIDALLQAYLICERADTLKLPVRLRYLAIDPQKHKKSVVKSKDNLSIINTVTTPALNQCLSGGILMRDLVAQTVARRPAGALGRLFVEKCRFTPNVDDACMCETGPTARPVCNGAASSQQREGGSCATAEKPRSDQKPRDKDDEAMRRYETACRDLVVRLARRLDEAGVKLPNATALSEAAKMAPESSSMTTPQFRELRRHLDGDRGKEAPLLKTLLDLDALDLKNKEHLRSMPALLEEGFGELHVDKLWCSAFRDAVMKPLLDLVTENSSSKFLKACHVEPQDAYTAKRCRDMQTTQPMLEADWTLCGPDVEQLDADLTEKFGLTTQKLDLDDRRHTLEQQEFDVVLLDRVLHQKPDIDAYLSNVKNLMRDDGFAVVCEVTSCYEIALATLTLKGRMIDTSKSNETPRRLYGAFLSRDDWSAEFERCGFDVIARRSSRTDAMMTAFLLRKRQTGGAAAPEPQTVSVDDATEFSWLSSLQRAVDRDDDAKVWLTSEKTFDNGAVGMGLCLRAEITKNRIRTLIDSCLDDQSKKMDLKGADTKAMMKKDMHSNVHRDGVWGSFRHFAVKEDQMHNHAETEHAFINTLIPGDLTSLTWVESPNKFLATCQKPSERRLVDVHFAALNFRDVMLATGRLSGDAIPGEFTDRDCLLGMEYAGCWRTESPKDSQTRMMGLSPAQALATTVLAEQRFTWPVPDGWTLEQAATVPVAYTTAYYALVVRGRVKKGDKVLIHAGSGGVGQAAISVALARGCEVFTTVSSDEKRVFLQQRFPSLQEKHFANSRTPDFEQHILRETNGRGVEAVLNSLSEEMLQVSQLFEDGLKNGTVKPLTTTVFPAEKATEAFRFMGQGKHIGKVLLKIRDDDQKGAQPLKVKAVCRTLCNPDHSYVITGGLGGFGLELAQWLVKRGARKLVLTSRTGIKTGYQNRCCSAWMKSGVKICISKADISKESGCQELLKEAQSLGPIAGLFHLAMVLRDNVFENQTVQNFKESAESKYWGTRHLDQFTRQMCGKEFKWFVVFSSISCGRGNAGQTNYGWTNSTMERIMEKRRRDNYPGLSIQWGAIGDVGVVLENMGDNTTVIGGTLPQRMPSCLQTLDAFLQWDDAVVVSSYVRAETSPLGGARKDDGAQADAVQTVAQIMGVSDASSIDANAQFGDLGLDSLMGVEIKQALERNFALNLSPKEIRAMTLNKLKEATTKPKSTSVKKVVTSKKEQNGAVMNGAMPGHGPSNAINNVAA